MAKRQLPRPTDAEVGILRVLWERGPSTVRQVYETLGRQKETGYTTVLKIMQIMADKGLVTRDERTRTHVYSAACSEDQTQRQLVRHLLDRVFGGSARKLVMQALSAQTTSPQELADIRRMLDQMEADRSPRE